jgi:hypothetical protein
LREQLLLFPEGALAALRVRKVLPGSRGSVTGSGPSPVGAPPFRRGRD